MVIQRLSLFHLREQEFIGQKGYGVVAASLGSMFSSTNKLYVRESLFFSMMLQDSLHEVGKKKSKERVNLSL